MALDQNLFTLNFKWSTTEPGHVDLVDPMGTVHYHRRRGPTPEHAFGLYDPLGGGLLSAVKNGPNGKVKTLQLYNPDAAIEIKSVGTLSFRWAFSFEEHDFEWKREECYLIRKPDPPVLVAITKEPPGRIRSTLAQILDYNINRFDVLDRKGLEIVLLTALLSFQDEDISPSNSQMSSSSSVPQRPVAQHNAAAAGPPQPPPKPAEAPEDQLAILQAREAREANEIVVAEFGEVQRYAGLCVDLVKDPTILFISIRSLTPGAVPKVVAVADLTKRWVHREDLLPDDLHQYVTYNEIEQDAAKKKKVIKLDDDKHKEKDKPYRPPENLTIRLSKIAMPELQPKARPSVSTRPVSMVQQSAPRPNDSKTRPAGPYPAGVLSAAQDSKGSSKPPQGSHKPNKLSRLNNISLHDMPPPQSNQTPALNSRPQGSSQYQPQRPHSAGSRPQGPYPSRPEFQQPSSSNPHPQTKPNWQQQAPAKPQQPQPQQPQSPNQQGQNQPTGQGQPQQPQLDLSTFGTLLGQAAMNSLSGLAHRAQDKFSKR